MTNNAGLAERMRLFRTHGITRDPKCFSSPPSELRPLNSEFPWYYEMLDLGYNYRISDIQCALGLSQLKKLPGFLKRRQEIAGRYDETFAGIPGITPLAVRPDVFHAYHLYVIKADYERLKTDRTGIFQTLREKGIGLNVHYIPVHLQPFYKNNFNTNQGLCPVAEASYEQILSLPMFPAMTDNDVERVIMALTEAIKIY